MDQEEPLPDIPMQQRLEQLRSHLSGTRYEDILPIVEAHMQTEQGQAIWEMGQRMVRGETVGFISRHESQGQPSQPASPATQQHSHQRSSVQQFQHVPAQPNVGGYVKMRDSSSSNVAPQWVSGLIASKCEELSCRACGAVQYKSEARALREVSRTAPKFKVCGGCCAVHYCNRACQKQDWHDHKPSCGK